MEIIDYVKTFPVKQFSHGQLLLASGNNSDTFLAIRDGFIKVTTTDESGRQRLLWIAGRYDILPLERFFNRKILQYDYVGYGEGSAYVIKKEALHKLIKERPVVAIDIARGFSEHFDDMSERLSALSKADVRSKLLHMLYNLSQKFSSSDVVELHSVGLNITHQDLADIIGASREVVTVELNKIRKEGYIDYSRSTFIVNAVKIRDHMTLLA